MYETLLYLEKIYLGQNEPLLAYALSHAYLIHGFVTARREEIIGDACAFMEKEDILFPVFKEHKDKSRARAYIEKNMPFSYRAAPGRNIFLCCRVKGDETWRKLRMKYFRFGIYLARVPVFYNETICYYFSDEMASGSVETPVSETKAASMITDDSSDPFCAINSAVVFEQMFQYTRAEEQLTRCLKKLRVYAKIM